MYQVSQHQYNMWSYLYRDYQRLDEQDQYEADGLDDEVDDNRDLATIMADRRAAEERMDERDGVLETRARKLPTMLQGSSLLLKNGNYLAHLSCETPYLCGNWLAPATSILS